MARNKVQFQKGLAMAEFTASYGTEEQCREALVKWRWPEGFACPHCASRRYSYCNPRHQFQCTACKVQTSVRAGTLFHKSRTPLTSC